MSQKMGPSDKPLFIMGSALAALMLIVGFKTFMGIKDSHHKGQPVAGFTAKPEKEEAAAPAANADGAAPTAAGPAVATADIAALVAAGDMAGGKKDFRRKCASCHSYKKGEPSRLGPNLYGVVDRARAAQPDYVEKYSDAMKAKGGNWTIEALNAFIKKPKTAVPGTGMSFVGMKKDKDRADLLAYIKTLSD